MKPTGTVYEIEILRGVSILLVFLFHLHFALLPSGFLGVDVFFVISGYLMALLYSRMENLNDVRAFYQKRLNRLLPAYFLVLIACIAAGAYILLPHEFTDTARYGWYSALLLPNIGFWLDASYFDSSFFKPFLNFWSLGVELQFYAIFPLIAYLLRRSRFLALMLALGSFAACIAATGISPKTSFFMMPFRIWEFMVGALWVPGVWAGAREAFGLARFAPQVIAPYKSTIGILSLLGIIALCTIPLGEFDHPKWTALAACLLTITAIRCGMPKAFIEGILGRGLVSLGKYSYSVYLVHFPIIAFATYQPFGGFLANELSVTSIAAVIALTALLSGLLYHFVEMPLRHGVFPKWNLRMYAACALLIVAILPVFSLANRIQYPTETQTILAAWHDRGEYRCGKMARLIHPFANACLISNESNSPGFLLVGNSHANAIKDSLVDAANKAQKPLYMMVDNCVMGSGDCTAVAVSQIARSIGATTVIVHASPDLVSIEAIAALSKEAPDLSIAFIDPVPVWPSNIVEALYANATEGTVLPHQTSIEYQAANHVLFDELEKIEYPNFLRYPVGNYFCNPNCRIMNENRQPLYFDSNHLSRTGAQVLAPLFGDIFEK